MLNCLPSLFSGNEISFQKKKTFDGTEHDSPGMFSRQTAEQQGTMMLRHQLMHYLLQSMATGDLSVTEYGQHSHDSGGDTAIPGSYGKDGITLDLGSDQCGPSSRLILLLLRRSCCSKY